MHVSISGRFSGCPALRAYWAFSWPKPSSLQQSLTRGCNATVALATLATMEATRRSTKHWQLTSSVMRFYCCILGIRQLLVICVFRWSHTNPQDSLFNPGLYQVRNVLKVDGTENVTKWNPPNSVWLKVLYPLPVHLYFPSIENYRLRLPHNREIWLLQQQSEL